MRIFESAGMAATHAVPRGRMIAGVALSDPLGEQRLERRDIWACILREGFMKWAERRADRDCRPVQKIAPVHPAAFGNAPPTADTPY